MAAAGCRARAASSSTGASISRRAAWRCLRSATGFAKAGQKTFPHAVQDVLAAIQFVRGNAKDFNIAPDRIGVFGHSAGGNLGALAALGGRSPLFANGYPQDAARQGEHRGQGVRRRLWRL